MKLTKQIRKQKIEKAFSKMDDEVQNLRKFIEQESDYRLSEKAECLLSARGFFDQIHSNLLSGLTTGAFDVTGD